MSTDKTFKACRQCRTKLSEPTTNRWEAFCSQACHDWNYRSRCRCCERTFHEVDEVRRSAGITKKRASHRITCDRATCKKQWKTGVGFGRFDHRATHIAASSRPVEIESQNQQVSEAKNGVSDALSWRLVAGPELTPHQLHAATLPDEAYERIEAKNRAALVEHFKAKPSPLGTVPINILGGRPFRGMPRIEDGEHTGDWWTQAFVWHPVAAPAPAPTDDVIDLPAFLRREPVTEPEPLKVAA